MKKLLARAVKYVRSTRAVSALEYALLVGVIATVIAAALVTFSGTIKSALVGVGAEVTEALGEVDD
jgi:Flp pilus assembly pilin Flp